MIDYSLGYELDGEHHGLGLGLSKPPDSFTVREHLEGGLYIETAYMPKRTCQMEPHPDYDLVTCSNCGYEEEKLILIPTVENASFDGKFCPNCGAEVIE